MAIGDSNYKPFNIKHAKRGAIVGVRFKSGETKQVKLSEEFCKYNSYDPEYTLMGLWEGLGTFFNYKGLSKDGKTTLCILPLGEIEGNPVYIDDLIINSRGNKIKVLATHISFEDCSWYQEYPETTLNNDKLNEIYYRHNSFEESLKLVANEAIKHAIKTGQVAIINKP